MVSQTALTLIWLKHSSCESMEEQASFNQITAVENEVAYAPLRVGFMSSSSSFYRRNCFLCHRELKAQIAKLAAENETLQNRLATAGKEVRAACALRRMSPSDTL